MNEKKAKEIRKTVYKDMSFKAETKYVPGNNGGLVTTGLKSIYKHYKNKYNREE